MTAGKRKSERKLEFSVEIDAPVEAVWKALSDGEELSRWFPLEARVKPGVGGSIWMSWGKPMEGEAPITAWEPNRHLGTVEKPPKEGAPQLAIDYFIEGRGGKTLLRLVHSGFDTGADWEDEYMESYKRGWPFVLENLRHYLERHRGTPRQVAWVRLKVTLPVGEIWERLLSPKGLLRRGTLDAAKPGERYAFEAATGDRFEGVVRFYSPPISFCGTVENRNNALLWVNLEKGSGGPPIWIWLSAYGWPQPEVDSFQQRWQSLLEGLFPEKATGETSN